MFTIVSVRAEHSDGTIDGVWVQGCCTSYQDAIQRTKMYADNGRGTSYALIETDSGWVPEGWVYPSYKPLCGILRADSSNSSPTLV